MEVQFLYTARCVHLVFGNWSFPFLRKQITSKQINYLTSSNQPDWAIVWEGSISPRSSRTCLVQSSPLDLDIRSDTPRGKTREQNLQIYPHKFYGSTCKIRLSLQTETFQYNPRKRVQDECNRSLLTKAQCSRHILQVSNMQCAPPPCCHVLFIQDGGRSARGWYCLSRSLWLFFSSWSSLWEGSVHHWRWIGYWFHHNWSFHEVCGWVMFENLRCTWSKLAGVLLINYLSRSRI